MTSLNMKSMSMSGQLQLYVVASSEAGLHYTQYTASARGQDGGGGGGGLLTRLQVTSSHHHQARILSTCRLYSHHLKH